MTLATQKGQFVNYAFSAPVGQGGLAAAIQIPESRFNFWQVY